MLYIYRWRCLVLARDICSGIESGAARIRGPRGEDGNSIELSGREFASDQGETGGGGGQNEFIITSRSGGARGNNRIGGRRERKRSER